MHTPSWGKHLITAVATAALLAACGGGGDDGPSRARIAHVLSVGDSLSDSGTFGYKFTVQGNDAAGQPFQVWPERVAGNYGSTLCAHYRATSATTFRSDPNCSNYAIGGAQINPLTDLGQPDTSPKSVLTQLQDAKAQGIPAHSLVLVDGGANDAAALVEAAIGALQGNSTALMGMLASRLSPAELQTLFADGQQAGLPAAGSQYMARLAEALAQSLRDNILSQDSARVGVLNVPPIAQTPRFVAVLQQIEALTNAETAANVKALADLWVQAFNGALQSALGSHQRVAIIDFYSSLKQQIAAPSQFGYTNVAMPACILGGITDDEPIQLCTATGLSAVLPTGETSATWWQNYMFADSFHPTPYGHQQMGNLVLDALDAKGWQ